MAHFWEHVAVGAGGGKGSTKVLFRICQCGTIEGSVPAGAPWEPKHLVLHAADCKEYDHRVFPDKDTE